VAGNLLCSPSTLYLDTLFTSSDKKISGFTRPHVTDSLRIYFFPLWPRPHVIGFVADIFFSTLESEFIFFRIRCRIRRIRVDGSRIRKEKVADSKISGYVYTYTDIFESATFSLRIWLPSTRIRRIRQRIRKKINPLSKVEKNKSATNP